MAVVQRPPARGHHRRQPSDPFEFDEPLEHDIFAQDFAKPSEDSTFRESSYNPAYFSDSGSGDEESCPSPPRETFVENSNWSDSQHGTSSDDEMLYHHMQRLDAGTMPACKSEGTEEKMEDGEQSRMVQSEMESLGVDNMGIPDAYDEWLQTASTDLPFELIPLETMVTDENCTEVTPSIPFMTPCAELSPSNLEPRTSNFAVGEKRGRVFNESSPSVRLAKTTRPGPKSDEEVLEPEPEVPAPNPEPEVLNSPAEEEEEEPPALLQKPLPPEIAARMLLDENYQPGKRPGSFISKDGQWIFKETVRVLGIRKKGDRNKEDKSDRWHNSGGVRGARDMPVKGSGRPIVRRRYGSVARQGVIMWRFHEYSLLDVVADPTTEDGQRVVEDRSTVVFHIMPKRNCRGRPSKADAEADAPAELWKDFMWSN